MSFFEYLVEKYGYNEPILSSELEYREYSKPWISKELASLCDSEKIVRFEKGIYYIPYNTALGISKLSPKKVIDMKYIGKDLEKKGYYSGMSLLNQMGLSDQVPNVIEVYTNEETSKKREITVGQSRVVLRKARTQITENNIAVQQFLELMNYVSPSFFDKKKKLITENYIRKYGISRKDITSYASAFPDKAMRTLIESEMIYCVTQ